MRMKKYLRYAAWVIAVLLLLVLLGDFGYSRYVAAKLKRWERTVERDEDGVMEGCQAYTLVPDEPSDTALLLVHGINDTPYCWRKMAPELAKRFHIRAMRMPGFGESIPVCAQKSAEDWIAAVKSEAKSLREKHEKVYIVAHSLGGAVSIQMLLREKEAQKDLLDGIVLLAPAIEVSNRRSPILPTRFWHRVGSLLLFTHTTYVPFGNDCKDPAEQNPANRVRFSTLRSIDETFKLIDGNRGREAEIRIPVLLVLSEQDSVNDHQASAAWFDKIASQRKKTHWQNDSGHLLQYDLGWQAVAEKIGAFIQP